MTMAAWPFGSHAQAVKDGDPAAEPFWPVCDGQRMVRIGLNEEIYCRSGTSRVAIIRRRLVDFRDVPTDVHGIAKRQQIASEPASTLTSWSARLIRQAHVPCR
jgi:hypothetical protein